MREPPITLTCDCGETTRARYGERWTCPSCDRTWDTSQIPREEYDRLSQSVRRYRLLAIGPPLLLTAVLLPLAIVVGIQFGLLLFAFVLMYGLFVLPKVRERAGRAVRESTSSWQLEPE